MWRLNKLRRFAFVLRFCHLCFHRLRSGTNQQQQDCVLILGSISRLLPGDYLIFPQELKICIYGTQHHFRHAPYRTKAEKVKKNKKKKGEVLPLPFSLSFSHEAIISPLPTWHKTVHYSTECQPLLSPPFNCGHGSFLKGREGSCSQQQRKPPWKGRHQCLGGD